MHIKNNEIYFITLIGLLFPMAVCIADMKLVMSYTTFAPRGYLLCLWGVVNNSRSLNSGSRSLGLYSFLGIFALSFISVFCYDYRNYLYILVYFLIALVIWNNITISKRIKDLSPFIKDICSDKYILFPCMTAAFFTFPPSQLTGYIICISFVSYFISYINQGATWLFISDNSAGAKMYKLFSPERTQMLQILLTGSASIIVTRICGMPLNITSIYFILGITLGAILAFYSRKNHGNIRYWIGFVNAGLFLLAIKPWGL